MREFIEKCSKCGKKYRVKIIILPAKMEDGHSWDTFYYCPYCKKETVDINLLSNEEVYTYEIEK